MNNLNTKTEGKFNWDGIDVGNFQLDNSQNFHAQQHSKNEVELENNNKTFIELVDQVNEVMEENVNCCESNKENTETLNLQDLNDAIDYLAAAVESDKENEGLLNSQDLNDAIDCLAAAAAAASAEEELAEKTTMNVEDSNSKDSQPRKSMPPSYLKAIKTEEALNYYDDAENNTFYNIGSLNAPNMNMGSKVDTDTVHATEATMRKVQQSTKKNLMLEWPTHDIFKEKQRTLTLAAGASGAFTAVPPPPPKAYVFKDIYQQKREEALRKRDNEERKTREFHSRPMPNFKACHTKTLQRPIAHLVTIPKTPLTLRTWLTNKELRKQKQEEKSQKPKVTQNIQPRSVGYLHKEPFMTKVPESTMVKQQPFRLGVENRLQQRRENNVTVQRTHEDQKKQVEIINKLTIAAPTNLYKFS